MGREKVKLTIKDNREIDSIIANLTERDLEAIRAEVERLVELKHRNPIFDAISGYDPDEFTKLACEYLDETDSDYQVMVLGFLYDALTRRVTREYAINIFRNRHSFDEVA